MKDTIYTKRNFKIFIILILFIVFVFLTFSVTVEAGRGRRAKPEPSFVGCYPKGTDPNPDATPSPPGTLTPETYSCYYPGGLGDIPDWCDDPRPDEDCQNNCNKCLSDCDTLPPAQQPSCRNACPCDCPDKTPEQMGSPKATQIYDIWVWNEPTCTETNQYKLACLQYEDADKLDKACACLQYSLWDGLCCGDDPIGQAEGTSTTVDDADMKESFCNDCEYIRREFEEIIWDDEVSKCCGDDDDDDPDWSDTSCANCPVGDNQGNRVWESENDACCGDDSDDDPDWGQTSCEECPLGNNLGTRVWDSNVTKCCGDDPNDDPDWSYISCNSCPVGNNLGDRVWEPNKGCCGDDTLAEDDPDWGEISCSSCPLGNNTRTRVWDTAINKCCGDDIDYNNNTDNPDEGEISCLGCPIGNNQGNRVWSNTSNTSQCCGDDTYDCTGPTKEQDDPDWDKASCLGCQVGQNVGGRDWYSSGGCCGDDVSDCARLAGQGICSMDSYNQTPFWLSSSLFEGDIRYIPCANQEYLADNTTWNACTGAFWLKTINGNDYLCSKKGQQSIVECCGDQDCNSVTDGKRLTTGQSVIPIDKSTPFITPLDNTQCGGTPSCIVSFNPSRGVSGANTTYTWNSTNDADSQIPYSCTGSLGSGTLNGASGSGAIAIPQDTQTCTLTAVNSAGTSATCQATITVTNQTVSEANKTYYCRVDAKFVKDLDTPWAQVNDTALNDKNNATCKKAGFIWTGTKCCSEADDPNEYYNDPGTIGGCWNKKFIQSVSFVNGTNNSVINYEGSFHGCAIDKRNFNTNNDALLNLTDQHTQGQLITNHPYCFNEPQGIYYCSYKEKWLLNDINRTHLSYSPLNTPNTNTTLTAECCPTNQCWDGSSCIANQRNDPLAQPLDGFRCIDGEWEQANLKFTMDGSVSGYCPKPTQCLVNPFAKNESEQCINSSQYVIKSGPYTVDDNYCENGQWTSRTKLLALKLMKMKSGSYTLFCDTKDNTLNNLNYIVGNDSNQIAANILINFKTNNFCVLNFGNNTIIGTTINIDIENVSSSNLNIFGVTSCKITSGNLSQYNPCDQSRKVWYNKNLRSLIFSQTAIRIPSDSNYLDSFDQFIGTPISNIINTIHRLITTPPADESYVNAFKRYDRLYFTEQTNRSVIGAIDGISYHNAVVEYKSLTTDICSFVAQFNAAKKDAYSGIACKKEYNNYYVLAQGDKFTSLDPYSIWPDLTAKIRLT